MTRSVWVLLLCGVLLCGNLTFAATRRPAPARVESAYTLSLHVSDSDVWLGAPGQGFAQAAEMVVRVLDAQGQPVDSVPVEFSVAPSWIHTEEVTSGGSGHIHTAYTFSFIWGRPGREWVDTVDHPQPTYQVGSIRLVRGPLATSMLPAAK